MSKNHNEDDESSDEGIETRTFKVIFLGDGAVGKTSIIHRFTEDIFDPEQKYKQTIGLDFFMKEVELTPSLRASLQCWDIGGQTIGQKMIKSYLRGSHAVMLVYDITSAESFENLEKWMSFVSEVFAEGPRPYIALVGNKTDLGFKRVVSLEAHTGFSKKYMIPFFYVSARTGDNVSAAMVKVASELCGIKRSFNELAEELNQQTVATIAPTSESAAPQSAVEQRPQSGEGNDENDKDKGCVIL